MTEQVSPTELQALRDRVAELEAASAQPQTVNVEGFEGLRQLSSAIENKTLDVFMLNRSVPDKTFCFSLIGFVAFMFIAALIALARQ